MCEINAVIEGKYMDKKFMYWPEPQELNVDEILKERVIPGNICWFYYERLYSELNNAPRGTVLDLACGTGFLSILLARSGHKVIGVDISEKSINYAQKLAKIYYCADKIDFRVMDASKLTFPDNTFDIITGEDCLHHILKYPGTIEGMYRVLKPGGKGIFFEPFGFNPFVNLLRKVNLIVSKRKFEAVLTNCELDALKKTFGRLVLSDLSVFYKIPVFLNRFISKHKNYSKWLWQTDNSLQNAFPFVKKYFSAAYMELYKASD